jgi:hypothetical protein
MPTDNALHFVQAKFGFDQQSLHLDANRCYGPIADRLKVPAQVTAAGDVSATDASSVTFKVGD